METETEHGIVLFDGVCNLCDWTVRFIIAQDPGGYFRFAALQSPAAQRLLQRHGLTLSPDPESVVLIEGGRAYTSSDAALRIARRLRDPWPIFWAATIVPRPMRDFVYRVIALNRYSWFGRQEECWLPTPALRARFLESEEAPDAPAS